MISSERRGPDTSKRRFMFMLSSLNHENVSKISGYKNKNV